MINHFDSNTHVRYVLEVDGSVVGFINVGPSESEDYKGCGEVFALYILNGYKGYGFGKKLIETGFAELKKLGFDKVVIGCLVGNKANDFYKHLGGKFIATKIYKRLQLPENYYCFENKTR